MHAPQNATGRTHHTTDPPRLSTDLTRGGVLKFCKPVVGTAGGVDEEFESKGKGVELGLDAEAFEFEGGHDGQKTWLLWVRWVWVGDLAIAALDLRDLWNTSTLLPPFL